MFSFPLRNIYLYRLYHCTKDLSQAFNLECRSVCFRPKKEVLQLFWAFVQCNGISATAYECYSLQYFGYSMGVFIVNLFLRLFTFSLEKGLRRNFVLACVNRIYPIAIQI